MDYDEDSDGGEPLDVEKREKAKNNVNGKLRSRLIDTGIADNAYIKNVIKAYVEEDESAEEQLYKEPYGA